MTRRRAARVGLMLACALAAGVADARPPRGLDEAPHSVSDSVATAPPPVPRSRRAAPPAEPSPTLTHALARAAGPETASARFAEGTHWIGANDLARLLGATKFWRADVRKLALRAGPHRIVLTVDNPFALVDDATVRLPVPVRSLEGELQAPVALIDSLPHDSTLARLLFDPARRLVLQLPPAGLVGTPEIVLDPGAARLSFPVDRPEELTVLSRGRPHFRIHLAGLFVGTLPESLPPTGLIHAIRSIPSTMGAAFELELDRRVAGFQVLPDPARRRLTLTFASTARSDLEPLAPERPPGPRPLRVVVLDPGHGGADAGVTVGEQVEKDLTLALAWRIKDEIARRLTARVMLTREDDRDLPEAQRAELANRARADLVLSLHFDGFPGPRASGATAYCPPATFGSAGGPGAAAGGELVILPWRDAATRYAVLGREAAENILSALELHAQGPTRLREVLPYPLLGVNAPGLVLECATLTSESDRARLARDPGMTELATSIVDGLEAYARGR